MFASGRSRSDGAQFAATPVVGCAQATTSQPPEGAGPVGMITSPETAIGSPWSPVEE